ncbi:hypothetical protein FACS189421_14200 [Bacteroidia bacterium]|nr:hypothetical protein FACS189421_14200 [Bacteroidia bacterium]
MKKIAILLTVHNRKQTTLSCLTALFNCALPEDYAIKVYLVDDGCTDGTSKALEVIFPQVKIIQGNGNLYWNRGMILAWQTAIEEDQSDFYFWLNDDTILYAKAILTILADSLLKNHQSIICGVCESSDKAMISYGGHLLIDKKKRLHPTGLPVECDFFNGNVVLIPHSVFLQVGFLDSIFQHSIGDNDYGLRAKREGIKSYISSQIIGMCDRRMKLPIWCNSDYKLKERIRDFKSPLTKKPRELYIYEKRHFGFFAALFRVCKVYAKLFLPSLRTMFGRVHIELE